MPTLRRRRTSLSRLTGDRRPRIDAAFDRDHRNATHGLTISRHVENPSTLVDDRPLRVAEYFDVLRLEREDLRDPILVQRPGRCRIVDQYHFSDLDLHR